MTSLSWSYRILSDRWVVVDDHRNQTGDKLTRYEAD